MLRFYVYVFSLVSVAKGIICVLFYCRIEPDLILFKVFLLLNFAFVSNIENQSLEQG